MFSKSDIRITDSRQRTVAMAVQDYTQILAHREGQIKASEARMGALVAQNEALTAAQRERDETITKQAASIAAYQAKLVDAQTVLSDKERLEEQVVSQMEVRCLPATCCTHPHTLQTLAPSFGVKNAREY